MRSAVCIVGGNSDHEPYVADLPCSALGFVPPPPQPKRKFRPVTRFRMPMDTTELRTFKAAFEARMEAQAAMGSMDELAAEAWRLADAHKQAREEVGPAAPHATYASALLRHSAALHVGADLVRRMEEHMNSLLAEAYQAALTTCTTTTTAERHHLKRADARRTRQLEQLTRLAKVARKELGSPPTAAAPGLEDLLAALAAALRRESDPATSSCPGGLLATSGTPSAASLVDSAIDGIAAALAQLDSGAADQGISGEQTSAAMSPPHPRPSNPPPPAQDATPPVTANPPDAGPPLRHRVEAAIDGYISVLNRERRELCRKDTLKAWAATAKAWRRKLELTPRLAHRDLTRSSADAPRSIEMLKDPTTGQLTSDDTEMLRVLREQRARLAAPPPGGRTGTYSADANTARDYPWAQAGAVDCFQLLTCAPAERADLLARVVDYATFKSVLGRAANQKAAGWDGAPNELLKNLPERLHRSLHAMFVAMWVTGETPETWKRSQTVMLYKKGDPTDPANYRPIGLALTVYKLWTALVTEVLADFAEAHGVLCDSQEGFRRRRSTQRQLGNLLNALEDAHHTRHDVYLLYIDFSNAFDTLDHDKLLQLMWDQGFPSHAVEVVRGLHTGACTTIRTSFGESDSIDIERGSLQGDGLSPFLFLLFIDPLLRWLHQGGRGYRPGCLTDAVKFYTYKGPLPVFDIKVHAADAERHACAAPAFADDVAVLAGSHTDLRRQADKVSAYLGWSGMSVNHTKCGATGMLHGAVAQGLVQGGALSEGGGHAAPPPGRHNKRQAHSLLAPGPRALQVLGSMANAHAQLAAPAQGSERVGH